MAYQSSEFLADSEPATRAYIDTNRIDFPVVRFPDTKLIRLYRAGAVPMTAVLDHEGRMLYVRRGMLETRAAVDSVMAAARDTVSAPANQALVAATRS